MQRTELRMQQYITNYIIIQYEQNMWLDFFHFFFDSERMLRWLPPARTKEERLFKNPSGKTNLQHVQKDSVPIGYRMKIGVVDIG